jgi:hypothetical protein
MYRDPERQPIGTHPEHSKRGFTLAIGRIIADKGEISKEIDHHHLQNS